MAVGHAVDARGIEADHAGVLQGLGVDYLERVAQRPLHVEVDVDKLVDLVEVGDDDLAGGDALPLQHAAGRQQFHMGAIEGRAAVDFEHRRQGTLVVDRQPAHPHLAAEQIEHRRRLPVGLQA